ARLGDWYRATAARNSGMAQLSLLRRASARYNQFLTLHPTEDGGRLKVAVAAEQVAKELQKVEQAAVPTLSLLTRVNPGSDKVRGTWQRQQGALMAESSSGASPSGLLAVPIAPHGNYEVSLEFASLGASEVGLCVPIGETSAQVIRRREDVAIYFIKGERI